MPVYFLNARNLVPLAHYRQREDLFETEQEVTINCRLPDY